MDLIHIEEPDTDLLYRQFLSGDTASYDKLLIRYGDGLTLYIYGYIHDWMDAEDLMIEAFARIMAKRPHIREGAYKAYLYRTGRNLALRFSERKRKVQMFSVDGMEPEIADNIISTGADPDAGITSPGAQINAAGASPVEAEVRQKEQKLILHRCLDRIEPELREALWLVYFEEMSYAQAASVMGVKEKRVDRLLYRGKRQMRQELEKEGVTNAYK